MEKQVHDLKRIELLKIEIIGYWICGMIICKFIEIMTTPFLFKILTKHSFKCLEIKIRCGIK